MTYDWHQFGFGMLAALVVSIIVRTLMRWSAEQGNPFIARDLLMENGRASRGAVVMMGAFAATTLHFIYYTLIGKMTEGYFGLYSAAWIAPVVVRMMTNPSPAPPTAPPVAP